MTKPDFSLLEDVVASKVLDAMKAASGALRALGIRHVVVGGLAVGATCREYLARNAPRYVEAFDVAVARAASEE